MAELDPLTGVMSGKTFFSQLSELLNEVRSKNFDLVLLFIDVDYMKHFNAHNGFQSGDKLLKKFPNLIAPLLDERARFFRYGGEKFTIILPYTSKDEAMLLAQKICDISRQSLSPSQPDNCDDAHCMGPAQVSVSIGVARLEEEMSSESLLQIAEEKMYEAKATGRDRVCA